MNRLILEVSLKPFTSLETTGVEAVVREMMAQWQGMIRQSDQISVLLWTADGSEILDYKGRFDEEIEWARYIGLANPHETYPGDPERKTVVSRTHLYTDSPARITYADLRKIVEIIRRTGRELSGKPVRVGATFDPGPEFAKSAFKYERHPEIATGSTIGNGSWVNCGATLHADSEAYAGFPNGIPEGTPLGAFLGRQARHFLADMGFDYLWFSNGFGFAVNAWSVKGAVFDGEHFHPGEAQKSRTAILRFWREFRRECPAFPVETRGSNFSAAMDLASGGCPIKEIYSGGFDLTAPPNSPWAAMDGDYGLEFVGFLSRIATLPPNDQITFRYYINDPWFLNSPWLDRYGREPHDIFMPLALARLNDEGCVTPIASLAFLTVDNSFGQLVEQCPGEITPHFLEALRDRPEDPGLVTWIYPFSEAHELTFGTAPDLGKVFFSDWFMRGAVNHGFPVNSVISSDHFLNAWRSRPATLLRTILICLVPPPDGPLEEALLSAVKQGGQVLLYGGLDRAGEKLREALNLQCVTSLTGEFEWISFLASDHLAFGKLPDRVCHRAVLSDGGIDTVSRMPNLRGWRQLAAVRQDAEERAYAVMTEFPEGGRLGWIRGTFCATITDEKLPVPLPETEWFHTERVMRLMLAEFGYSCLVEKPSADIRDPLFVTASCRNGFYFSGYQPSTLAKWRLRFPEGAPLLTGCDAWLEDGHAIYQMPRAWHRECRCFVRQETAGAVSCSEQISGEVGIRRRILITGLRDASVWFCPEPDSSGLRLAPNDPWPFAGNSMPWSTAPDGRSVTVNGVTGSLLISW